MLNPCDGFRNNLANGLTAKEAMNRICLNCKCSCGDLSEFVLKCKTCNDRGVRWTSWGTHAAGDYETFTVPCKCTET